MTPSCLSNHSPASTKHSFYSASCSLENLFLAFWSSTYCLVTTPRDLVPPICWWHSSVHLYASPFFIHPIWCRRLLCLLFLFRFFFPLHSQTQHDQVWGLNWFQFLEIKFQKVGGGGTTVASPCGNWALGVPQVSVLPVMLFNTYTKPLEIWGRCRQYADDTKYYFCISSIKVGASGNPELVSGISNGTHEEGEWTADKRKLITERESVNWLAEEKPDLNGFTTDL